ncbi:MAG TPA: hypothetical protein VLT90_07625 [Terriglobales bacterium]|nr:hypothetical protein [Terriglobales bacterium]
MVVKASAVTRLLVAWFVITGASLFAADRAALVREAIIYLSPDTSSAKLGNVERGRELIILDTSRQWLHVEALFGPEKTITGWIQEKGAVRTTTPQGDLILYGEAVNSEDEGSRRHGRKGAADDARRLYYRVYDYFPNSPVAGEALYRAADIQWQIERADVLSRPSAREKESYLREGIDEQWMKLVMKKYPGTKWADLAAFHLIDNKLCGDWQGASKCPDKEADQYEKYVKEHPQSPSAPEALYDAAYRRAALIEIYKTEEQSKKSDESKNRAIALAQQLVSQYSQSDWAARGQALLFLLQQGVPAYGNATD